MSLIKSSITLALIAGAVFFYNSGMTNPASPGSINQENQTVLEPEKVAQIDDKISDSPHSLAITADSSEAYMIGEEQSYPSDVDEDLDGLGPLEASVFQEVYMIGTDRINDLSDYSIKKFDGEKLFELTSFAGSSMSRVTDIDRGGEHVFIGYNKKISTNNSGIKAHTLIYDTEKQIIERTVELEGLPRAGAVLAGENGFYATSEGKVSRYGIEGEREWRVDLDYPDLTRGAPYPVLEKNGGDVYLASTVSNGHHEIVAAKISSDGDKEWSEKIDLQGLKDKVSAVAVSDDGFLIASTSKYVESVEPLITYPRDVVLKKLDLSDGSTEWTQVYNNPGSSNEKVLSLEETEEGFRALVKTRKMEEIDARPIETGVEKMNSLMKISASGNITEVVNTQNYSTERAFMLESVYGMKGNSLSRLQTTSTQVNTSQPSYYTNESYQEKASKEENDWYQELRDTEMDIEAFNSEGNLHLRITNTGNRSISGNGFRAYYATPNFDPVRYRVLELQSDSDLVLEQEQNRCLTQDTELSPGESLTCLTGLKYPEEKRIDIEIMAEDVSYEKSLTID